MDAVGDDKRQVEQVVNHQHILDLFPNSEFQPGEQAILFIASQLKEMWSCKLARDFPTRQFDVNLMDEGELADYQITFWQR